ncbi:MAG TPA: KilA-N domain-containing protein [Nitrospiraceae bacterium]
MVDAHHTTTDLVIADIIIVQDAHGRYSLNTLYKASGSTARKEPSKWLANTSTQELIAELETQNTFSCIDVVKGGNAAGTYAHELLAVSYAGWISPAFQLKVNQAFLDMKQGQRTTLPTLHDPAYQMLMQAVIDLDTTRHHVAQLEATQHSQMQAIIENQARTIEALQHSARAESKADLALEDARYLAVEEFVMKNGLIHQYPDSCWRSMSEWLKKFCQAYGLEIRTTSVYGKKWNDENTYPWQAFSAFCRYDRQRAKQIALVPKVHPKADEA